MLHDFKKGEEEEKKKTFWNSSSGILSVNQVFCAILPKSLHTKIRGLTQYIRIRIRKLLPVSLINSIVLALLDRIDRFIQPKT